MRGGPLNFLQGSYRSAYGFSRSRMRSACQIELVKTCPMWSYIQREGTSILVAAWQATCVNHFICLCGLHLLAQSWQQLGNRLLTGGFKGKGEHSGSSLLLGPYSQDIPTTQSLLGCINLCAIAIHLREIQMLAGAAPMQSLQFVSES